MNDVLPKPFTKEGLLKILESQLSHLCSSPPMSQAMMGGSVGISSIKEENSPLKSPTSDWNSSGQLTGVSPSTAGLTDDPYLSVSSMRPPGHPAVETLLHHQQRQHTPNGAFSSPEDSLPRGHCRPASEMSPAMEESPVDAKRQRMFIQSHQMAAPFVPMQGR